MGSSYTGGGGSGGRIAVQFSTKTSTRTLSATGGAGGYPATAGPSERHHKHRTDIRGCRMVVRSWVEQSSVGNQPDITHCTLLYPCFNY